MIATGPLQGMRDFLPLEVRQRDFLMTAFKAVYERYGFEPIETPLLERLDVLLGKGGDENEKLIFKALKRGAALERALEAKEELADAGLRFDLTVPLARYYMEHRAELPRPFRRYHMGPVFRADRPGRGRFREFYQCDVDIIGVADVAAEVEVLLATTGALDAVGFSGFSVRLNDRRLLKAVLRHLGVAEEHQASAVVALDKLDKIGLEGVSKELQERGLAADVAEKLKLLDAPGIGQLPAAQGLEVLKTRLGLMDEEPALNALGRIISELSEVRGEAVAISIEPLLARGMGYYTGPIFEVGVEGVPFSLAGGGRYDGLVERFGKESIPAVGFSIGFERIALLMSERGAFPADLARVDAYVTVFSAEDRGYSLKLSECLRKRDLRVITSLRAGGLKHQIKEASERGARYAIIAGPDERARGEVQLKNLATGEASQMKEGEVAGVLGLE